MKTTKIFIKTRIKLISMVTLLALLISYCTLPALATEDIYDANSAVQEVAPEDKLSDALRAQFEETDDENSKPITEAFEETADRTSEQMIEASEKTAYAAIWITDIDYAEVNKKVLSEALSISEPATLCSPDADLSRAFEKNELLDEEVEDSFTIEEVQSYISAKRAEAKKMYIEQNTAFAEEKLKDKEIFFISSYSPVIIIHATYDEILDVASDSTVESVDSFLTGTYESFNVNTLTVTSEYTIDQIKSAVRADYPIAQGMTGAGVRVGIVELEYPTDIDSNSNKIQVGPDRNVTNTDRTHAQAVSDIILSFVPNIENGLYCTSIMANNENAYQAIEDLIDQNVNIINGSYGTSYYEWDGLTYVLQNTYYDDISAWFDHIAFNHSVHMIMASGNDGEVGTDYVSPEALAANVISVGSTNLNSLSSYADDSCSTFSSYNTVYGRWECRVSKPDISAPGDNLILPAYLSEFSSVDGTSFAAPIVTSIVTQLCQRRSALLTLQDTVKAIIAAGITSAYSQRYTPGSTFFEQAGAGMIDAQGAYYIANNSRYVNSTLSGTQTSKTYTFTVTSSDSSIRIALAFLLYSKFGSGSDHVNGSPSLGELDNLNVRVYKGGQFVASSTSTYNNLEVLQFNPSLYGTGTYTIEVYRNVGGPTTYFGIAWY